jgi:hypothetical protein
MKKSFTVALLIALTSIGAGSFLASQANAAETRDHRTCKPPKCRDHRGPVVVVPPPPQPPARVVEQAPPVAVDDSEPTARISCKKGRKIVRRAGFYDVRSVVCSGNTFMYHARSENDARASVFVNMNGQIVDVVYFTH